MSRLATRYTAWAHQTFDALITTVVLRHNAFPTLGSLVKDRKDAFTTIMISLVFIFVQIQLICQAHTIEL